jgi:ankyrin repeat protein
MMIRQNRAGAVQKLLENGTNVDDVELASGKTAIMEAAYLRRVHICHILLSSGCRLHLKDSEQNTALHWAAASGDAEVCRLLVEAGAQLDEYNRYGKTPIQKAARDGHTEAVECLLNCWTAQAGHAAALINGFTDASKSGNISTARAFINKGVKPQKIKGSWQLVANAAASGSQPMLDFLVAHRCNLKDRSPGKF